MGLKLNCLLLAAAGLNASVPIRFQEQPNSPVQFHEATYRLGWDIHLSPYTGGEDLLFAHRSLERLEGWVVGKSAVFYSKTAPARLWRLNELLLGWCAANFFAVVVQHEVFGHGYRIRDINHGRVKVNGYMFEVPPPYGPGGGATSYSVSNRFTTTEESSVAMAGVESTAILALLTKLKWMEASKIDPRQTILYLLSQHDLNLYIGSLKSAGSLEGHDISGYVHSLNYTYPAHLLSNGRLRSLSWINLGDPMTYYSLYAWFHYLSSGKETSIPMIPAWGAGYLPNVRLGLTPFGPEFFIENYLLCGHRPYYFYLKGGRHSNNNYFGIGFYAPKIWTFDQWSIGARLDAWRQPKLLLQQGRVSILDINFNVQPDKNDPLYPYSQQYQVRYGAGGSMIFDYRSSGRSGFELELGYKAQGFLPGYSLRPFPTVRLFYSLFL